MRRQGPLVRYLMRRSEGNPFFVAEYLRSAVAEKLLYRDARGRWQVAEPGDAKATESVYEALPLPHSVHDLVGRRLDGLGAEARRLAERACVLGREVDEELLARMSRGSKPRKMDALRELLARQILEELGAGTFRFLHDPIREVAYDRLTSRRRRELHRSAAEAMEACFGADRPEHLGAFGHHWKQAGHKDRARRCFLGGARHAVSRYALVEAERLYRAYLALVGAPTAESIQARIELGNDVLKVQGRLDEARRELNLALESAFHTADPTSELRSRRKLADVQYHLGRVEESQACYTQALALARETGDESSEALLLADLAYIDCEQGRLEQADARYEQAIALAHRTVLCAVSGYRNRDARAIARAHETMTEVSNRGPRQDRFHPGNGGRGLANPT